VIDLCGLWTAEGTRAEDEAGVFAEDLCEAACVEAVEADQLDANALPAGAVRRCLG
jgi:hypothetical protein